MKASPYFTQKTRILLGGACIFLGAAMLAGSWCIPFLFESSSMLYKFGFQKVLLRVGKIAGITAAMLLTLQLLLVSRFIILDRIFALNRMVAFHQVNGVVIVILSLFHPLVILASEDFVLFRVEWRYWPEFLGVGLSVVIIGIGATAIWRETFGLSYESWLRRHRLAAIAVVACVGVHILFVSETFESGLPRALALCATGLNIMLMVLKGGRGFFSSRRKYTISHVSLAGENACAITATPGDGAAFSYLPGQFAFITPLSKNIPRETHPFTISSTPSRPGALQFVIRARGDWTGRVHRLRPGETILIDGPYGRFSHLTFPESDSIIMIAGGIGVTPMLSMLGFMADANDRRRILLIWSNRTREAIVQPERLDELQHRLQRLEVVNIITRGDVKGEGGRLDRERLGHLLEGWSRTARVFVCGPPGMMKSVNAMLLAIGFMASRIHMEKFRF